MSHPSLEAYFNGLKCFLVKIYIKALRICECIDEAHTKEDDLDKIADALAISEPLIRVKGGEKITKLNVVALFSKAAKSLDEAEKVFEEVACTLAQKLLNEELTKRKAFELGEKHAKELIVNFVTQKRKSAGAAFSADLLLKLDDLPACFEATSFEL